MKWYALMLFLLVGFVWSASAQQIDSNLVGEYVTTDNSRCKPCTLSIPASGPVKFTMVASPVEVLHAQLTDPDSIRIILQAGGKLDLGLTVTGSLVGFYTDANMTYRNVPVTFQRISVSTTEQQEVATAWSVKKHILGQSVYNDVGDKIGDINDLIVTPNKSVSYAIIGVGGFLGVGEHEIAVPVGRLKQQEGKIVLPGATKDTLKAAPKFEYAK
jgi:sporulation protein YlmC with PRC-barrel domain